MTDVAAFSLISATTSSVIKSCNNCSDFIICLIPGASNDESTLLCQGECTKSPDLG